MTITPDPKKKIKEGRRDREFGAMASRRQYNRIGWVILMVANKIKYIKDIKFYYEFNGKGHVHCHGSIIVEDNIVKMDTLKRFKLGICSAFSRKDTSEYYNDICCKIKPRDDDKIVVNNDNEILRREYSSWEEYCKKDQEALIKCYPWMLPLEGKHLTSFNEQCDEDEKDMKVRGFNIKDLD